MKKTRTEAVAAVIALAICTSSRAADLKTSRFTWTFDARGITQSITVDGKPLPVQKLKTILTQDNRLPESFFYISDGQYIWRFSGGDRIAMRYTPKNEWMEAEVIYSIGNVGQCWLFSIACNTDSPLNGMRSAQAMRVGDYVCGVIPLNVETNPEGGYSPDHILVRAAPPYLDKQKFAVFFCKPSELLATQDKIEAHYNLPRVARMRMDRRNSKPYIMIVPDGSYRPMSWEVLQLLDRIGGRQNYTVLLSSGFALDGLAKDEPFKIAPGIVPFVDDLQKYGVEVGLHCFLTHVAKNSWYTIKHPEMFIPADPNDPELSGSLTVRFDANAYEKRIAKHMADTIVKLRIGWVYIDGVANLSGAGFGAGDEWHLQRRAMYAFHAALDDAHWQLWGFNDGWCTGNLSSRFGARDYWDPPVRPKPIDDIKSLIALAPSVRAAGIPLDSGWMNTFIHQSNKIENGQIVSRNRPTTLDEWKFYAKACGDNNIPIGLQFQYKAWMAQPNRAEVEGLIRDVVDPVPAFIAALLKNGDGRRIQEFVNKQLKGM